MTDRKKPGAAFWATLVLAAVALFVAALGPAAWTSSRTGVGVKAVSSLYEPLLSRSPHAVRKILETYSTWWAPPHWSWEHVVFVREHGQELERIELRVFWSSEPRGTTVSPLLPSPLPTR